MNPYDGSRNFSCCSRGSSSHIPPRFGLITSLNSWRPEMFGVNSIIP